MLSSTYHKIIRSPWKLSQNYYCKRGFFEKVDRDWEKAWKEKVTPWDTKGTICPPLVEAVAKGKLICEGKKALVPGCGTGYECFFLEQAGCSQVVGMDLSTTAIEVAKKYHSIQNPSSNILFEAGNFFSYVSGEPYDLIFDYLFFAAIDPPLRGEWASAVARNLQPNGVLATLIFPLKTEDPSKGPPYQVALEDYEAVLGPWGFRVTAIDKVTSPL